MKNLPIFALSILLALTSCQSKRCEEDVICQSYVHRYGVELEPDEWNERGQHGRVISTRRDGVIVSNSYEAGVLDGESAYTFPHREIVQKREIYSRGQLQQEFFNYTNGLPQKQVVHEAPGRHTATVWYENGAPQSKEQFHEGRLVQGAYYNMDNREESRVENGSGVRIQRDGFGQPLSHDQIYEGQMVLRTTYHPNGNPSALTPYVNGQIEGMRRTYSHGGEPATLEEWSNGVQHGNTVIYENGEKSSDLPYVQGYAHGIEQRYREGGMLVQKNTWVKGKKHGPCYTNVGDATQTDWYFQGKLVNKPTFDALSNQ
ncbi:MAG: hypothetical protein LW832_03035 [Parachlamydia sp.]|jgi:antitoxin component YwqK of YwqJK toxin-antitoxin module|nr:hypothetical protein [Parachlamydia sp.]